MRKPREGQDIPNLRDSLPAEPVHSHFALTREEQSSPPPSPSPPPYHTITLCRPICAGLCSQEGGRSYGTAAEDTLVGQAGREQLVGTEDLSVLVHSPIVLTVLWGGPEPRGGVRFFKWRRGRKKKKLRFHITPKAWSKFTGPLFRRFRSLSYLGI